MGKERNVKTMNATAIYPGDKITAYGQTYTVWSILYQDKYAYPGQADIEFIDDAGNYHHWKEYYDGGTIIREGIPAKYFRETSGAVSENGKGPIARIKPRRNNMPGVIAEILRPKGPDIWLGSFSTEESAMKAIRDYSATNRLCWKEM